MRWRWIVCFLIALIVVLVTTTYLIVSRYDYNDLKPRIATAVRKATGRKLTLAGNVEVGLGLTPALTIEDVAFQNASWATEENMATVERLELRVAILPLLQGTVDVKRLVLVEPDILVETSKTGRLNLHFDGLKEQVTETEVSPDPSAGSHPPLPLVFSDITVKGGSLTYLDHRSGRTQRLALQGITAAMASDGSISLDLSGIYNDVPCRLELTGGTVPQLTDPKRTFPVDLSLSMGKTTLSANGSVSEVIRTKAIDLTVTAQGTSLPELLNLFGIRDIPDVGPFRLSGRLGDLGGRLSATDIEVELGHEDLAVVTVTEGRIDDLTAFDGIDFSAAGRGPAVRDVLALFHMSDVPRIGPFEVSGKVTARHHRWRVSELKLSAGEEGVVHVTLSGSVPDVTRLTGMDLDFTLQGSDLAKIKTIIDKEVPIGGPFQVSGHASFPAEKVIEFDQVKAAADKSRLAGNAVVALDADPPRITSTIRAESLDLVPLFKRRSGEGQGSPQPPSGDAGERKRFFSREPLPFEQLRKWDADLDLEAAHVALPFLNADDIATRFILQRGDLSVSPLRFTTADGKLDGGLKVSQRGTAPTVETAIRIDGLDLGRAIEQLGLSRFLNGVFDMDVDVTGRGRSMADLMATLDGKASVVMKDGNIDERLLGFIGGDLTTGLLEWVNPFKKEGKHTAIDCLVIGLNFDAGRAESSALLLDTEKVTVVGHGEADLGTEMLDVSFKPTPKKGVSIKGLGNLSLSLGQLTKPFKLTGTFANPSLAVDPTETLFTLGKAVGGAALFGPVGLAAALAGGKLGDKDPCLAAIEATQEGNSDEVAPE